MEIDCSQPVTRQAPSRLASAAARFIIGELISSRNTVTHPRVPAVHSNASLSLGERSEKMAAILTNLRNTVIAGFILSVVLFILYYAVYMRRRQAS